jgi:hypothetical protein
MLPDYSGQVDGQGYKVSMDDHGKLMVQLVPPALVEQTARVLGYGAKKYARNNWQRGMRWSEVSGALERHLMAWKRGEDMDPESGEMHLAHLACCVAFLLHYATDSRYAEFDDRDFKPHAPFFSTVTYACPTCTGIVYTGVEHRCLLKTP